MIGATFKDRYRVVRELGSGSSATVYEALDQQTNNGRVAIKVLKPEFSHNKRFVERFRREIRAAQLLRSPLIVRVLDWGVQSEIYFIIFELVDGQTLRQIMDQHRKLPIEDSLHLAIQMLMGVEEAHQAQIIHRDLKPENMMVTQTGELKLMDFGIAKDAAMGGLTNDGTMIGTPYYISPEQARGGKVDARSDVYSIGSVLYEMLAGRPPFEADSPYAIILKHTNEIPPSLSQLNPEIAPHLDNLVQRALAKDPEMRYQSAGEMASVLRRYLGVTTVLPKHKTNRKATTSYNQKQAGWFEQFVKPDGKPTNNGIMALVLALLLLFIVLGVVIMAVTSSTSSGSGSKISTSGLPLTLPTNTLVVSTTSSILPPTVTAAATPKPSGSPTPNSKDVDNFQNGVAAIVNKDWKLAISIFEGLSTTGYKPQEVKDRLGVAYCTYGTELASSGDPSESQTMLENCLKVNPDNADANALLDKVKFYRDGSIFASQKNWGAAFPPLESLYALDKNFRGFGPILFDAYLQYITTLINDKSYDEALLVCEKAKNMDVGGDPAAADAQCKKIQELKSPPTAVVVRTYAAPATQKPATQKPLDTPVPATAAAPPPPPTAVPPTPVPTKPKAPPPSEGVIGVKQS
jgi:serine/threonine protein kinase